MCTCEKCTGQEAVLLPEFENIFNNKLETIYPEMEFEAMPVNVSRRDERYIKWVQESLNKILGLKLKVDGDAGTNTINAIKSFQLKNGIDAIGKVGPLTEAALIKANALIAAPTPVVTPVPGSTFNCSPAPAMPASISSILALTNTMIAKIPLVGSTGIVNPTTARYLNCTEQSIAYSTFQNSLDYSKIFITNGLGFSGRPFTIAIPIAGKYYVIMMLGNSPSNGTLIHELVHAWQSQHHGSNPQAFMWAAVLSQLKALADVPLAKSTAAAVVYSKILPTNNPYTLYQATKSAAIAFANEDSCAYAYIPGKDFDKYGAEQIAQQVEDDFLGNNSNPKITNIIKSVAVNTRSILNEASLSIIGFERKSAPNVIWGPC
jgi:peptidoglycan hydrolase-like protein with peptidoglycan-binding domain